MNSFSFSLLLFLLVFIHLPLNRRTANALLSHNVNSILKEPLVGNFYPQKRRKLSTSSSLSAKNNDGGDEDNEKNTLMDRLNDFLDTPIINIEDDNEDDNANWFKTLLKNDYDLAEALYTSAFLTIMVVLSQELLRMQMYGENYVPFKSGGGGQLF